MGNTPRISAIAAMGRDRTIGKDNKIPWDIPQDMKYLRETTRGKPLIMGRHTYESIHAMRGTNPQTERALPGRLNIVITRDGDYFGKTPPEGVLLAATPAEGLSVALDYAAQNAIDEIFVFGGATIYAALLNKVERLYLTIIDRYYGGDSFFPEINADEWSIISENTIPEKDGNPALKFKVLERNIP